MINKSKFTEEFVDKVMSSFIIDDNGCWIWTRSISPTTGYGQIMFQYKGYNAHRVVWEIFNGPIPNGICVLHSCDVRACANPSHLFLGTKGENNTDRANKKRGIYGENQWNSKINEEIVKEIRESELSSRVLAKKYGVCPTLIKNVRHYRIWKWVE